MLHKVKMMWQGKARNVTRNNCNILSVIYPIPYSGPVCGAGIFRIQGPTVITLIIFYWPYSDRRRGGNGGGDNVQTVGASGRKRKSWGNLRDDPLVHSLRENCIGFVGSIIDSGILCIVLAP